MASATALLPSHSAAQPSPPAFSSADHVAVLQQIADGPHRGRVARRYMDYVRALGVAAEPAAPGLIDRALRIGSTLVLKIDGNRVLRIFDLPDRNGRDRPKPSRLPGVRATATPPIRRFRDLQRMSPVGLFDQEPRRCQCRRRPNNPTTVALGRTCAVMWSGLELPQWRRLAKPPRRSATIPSFEWPFRCNRDGKSSEQAGTKLPDRWPLFEVRPSPRWLRQLTPCLRGREEPASLRRRSRRQASSSHCRRRDRMGSVDIQPTCVSPC